MTYPNSSSVSKQEIEKRVKCEPEIQIQTLIAQKNTTIILYSNGEIIEGPEGVSYNTLRSSGRITIARSTKYNELISKIHCILGTRRNDIRLKLTFRLPTAIGHDLIRYAALPIENDDDVEFMLDMPSQCPTLIFLELYVEKESITSPTYIMDTTIQSIHSNIAAYGLLLRDNTSIPAIHGVQPFNEWLGYNESLHPQSQNEHDNAGPSYVHEDHNEYVNAGPSYAHEEHDEYDNVGLSNANQNESIESPDDPIMDSHSVADFFKRPLWDPDDPFLQKGMIFASKLELQEAVKIYSIKQHRKYVVKESNKSGWVVCCTKLKSKEACHWSLRAKKKATHGYFEITKYNDEHTCSDLVLCGI